MIEEVRSHENKQESFKKPIFDREYPNLSRNHVTTMSPIPSEDTSITEMYAVDRILFDGYVYRFKPTFNSNFVERFLVIT